jgi:hypothetical protein
MTTELHAPSLGSSQGGLRTLRYETALELGNRGHLLEHELTSGAFDLW